MCVCLTVLCVCCVRKLGVWGAVAERCKLDITDVYHGRDACYACKEADQSTTESSQRIICRSPTRYARTPLCVCPLAPNLKLPHPLTQVRFNTVVSAADSRLASMAYAQKLAQTRLERSQQRSKWYMLSEQERTDILVTMQRLQAWTGHTRSDPCSSLAL